MTSLRGTPVGDSIHTALQKIAATLAPKAEDFLDKLREEFSARTGHTKDYRESRQGLRLIEEALHARPTLDVAYHLPTLR